MEYARIFIHQLADLDAFLNGPVYCYYVTIHDDVVVKYLDLCFEIVLICWGKQKFLLTSAMRI